MDNMWSVPNPYAAPKIECGSFSFDKKLYFQDIECSMAHAAMLGGVGLIDAQMSDRIIEALGAILDGLDMGQIPFDDSAKSVRAFLDKLLDERVEGASALLNSFRSDNERTSGALRLYLRDEWMDMRPNAVRIMSELCRIAKNNPSALFSQTLIATAMMLMRDTERMNGLCEKSNKSPLGADSPEGPRPGIDRLMMCSSLGFTENLLNSLDALTDCDFCIEAAAHFSVMALHLSRLLASLAEAESSGEITVTLGSVSPLRRLLGAPQSAFSLALNESSNLPFSALGDMSQSSEALIRSCESIKSALKMLIPGITALTISENCLQGTASATSVERQLDYLAKFIDKQNDGSGRY